MLTLLLVVSVYLVRINRIVPFIWLTLFFSPLFSGLLLPVSQDQTPENFGFWLGFLRDRKMWGRQRPGHRLLFPSRGASLPGFQLHWGQSLPYWSQHLSSRTAAGPSPWVPVTPTPTLVLKVSPAVCGFCSLGCLIFLRFSFQVF